MAMLARYAWWGGVVMIPEEARTRVSVRCDRRVWVLVIQGELTSSADVPLANAYAEASGAGAQRLVLDFTRATTINSAGIALIMRIVTDCHRRGQALAFSGLDAHFETLFGMAGLPQYGAVYRTAADASAALRDA